MAENKAPKKTMTFEAEHKGIRVELVFQFDTGGVHLLRATPLPSGEQAQEPELAQPE